MPCKSLDPGLVQNSDIDLPISDMPAEPEEHQSFLQKYCRHCRLLPETEQLESLRRLEQFRRFRNLHGRAGLEVDDAAEVLFPHLPSS